MSNYARTDNITCLESNFTSDFPLLQTSKACYCDAYATYEEADIQLDMDNFNEAYRVEQLEAQAARIQAEKARMQSTAQRAAEAAQANHAAADALKQKYHDEAVERQNAAYAAKDAELAAAREAQTAAEMAAQDRIQAAEKARQERQHKNELARAEAQA